MKIEISNTICEVKSTSLFRKQLKKIYKQNKGIKDLIYIINKLANFETLEPKYKNHNLINYGTYKDCMECHIKPDWLLVYKYVDNYLVLLLVATGSHSEILDK